MSFQIASAQRTLIIAEELGAIREQFGDKRRSEIVLQTADIKQLDVTLEVGQISETVTVSAEAPLIDTSAATAGTASSSARAR